MGCDNLTNLLTLHVLPLFFPSLDCLFPLMFHLTISNRKLLYCTVVSLKLRWLILLYTLLYVCGCRQLESKVFKKVVSLKLEVC